MASGYEKFFKAAREAKGKRPPEVESRPKAPAGLTAEEALRQLWRQKIRERRRPKFPMQSLVGSMLMVVVAALLWWKIDEVESWFDRIEISWVGAAAANSAKSAGSTASQPANPAGAATAPVLASAPSGDVVSSEELKYFEVLRRRKMELDEREKEIMLMEEELHKQKKEVEARIAKLEETRREIAGVLQERVQIDEARVKQLVEVYSSMKPQQAAQVLAELNEDLAVDVVARMKKKSAADILGLLQPQKARRISERIMGYDRPVAGQGSGR